MSIGGTETRGVNMYQVGERIIYGSNGVCVIDEIKMIEVPHTGEEKAYYIIKPIYQECKISVPTDTKMFMRPIISAEEARTLVENIPNVDAQPYYNTALRQLQDYYEKKISSHSCEDLIELTVSLHRKKIQVLQQKRKFGAIDERYMKRAEELLFGELSVVLDMPKAEVREMISKQMEQL
jgi:CarD family transcriptional regulator